MAHRGLALQLDVVLVAVDIEACLGSVVDAPHHDRRDFDRVASLIVDLQPLAIKIARAQRHLAPGIERIGAAQPQSTASWRYENDIITISSVVKAFVHGAK